jgi:hypothetical protein
MLVPQYMYYKVSQFLDYYLVWKTTNITPDRAQ